MFVHSIVNHRSFHVINGYKHAGVKTPMADKATSVRKQWVTLVEVQLCEVHEAACGST